MTPDVDILQLISASTGLKKVSNVNGRGPEYAGACPFCGGEDRLRVQPDMGQWWCRQCSPNEHWQSAADFVMRRDGVDFKEAMSRLGLKTGRATPQQDQTWDYYDADGTLSYRVVRYVKGGVKQYAQHHLGPRGEWVKGLNGQTPTLYRLPDVLKAATTGDTIYIAEGEKCADAVRAFGLVATTNSGGAGKWRDGFGNFLRGAADVVILADNDEPGRKHAEQVLRNVRPIVPSARVVVFSELPEGGDVADWIALGHGADELAERCAPPIAGEIVTSAPPTKPVGPVEYVPAPDWRTKGVTAAALYHAEFQPLIWTVENILPEGAALLAGKPKSRKSWAALGVAVASACGSKALGRLAARQGRVLYLDLESNQRRMRGRLFSMIGHEMRRLENLHIYTDWPRGEEGLAALEEWMAAYPDTVLIVIDVLADFRRPKDPKEDPYAYDRETVKPINAFAERHRVTVFMVHHTRKMKADDVFDEISGSTGLPSAVATMWVLGRAPNGSGEMILALRGRDLIEDEPLALEWDDYANTFVITGGAADAAISAERRAVLDVLADDADWTPKDIAAELQKPANTVKQLLRALLSEGLVTKTGYGKYARVPSRTNSAHSDHSANSANSANSESDPKSYRVSDSLTRNNSLTNSLEAHQDAVNSPSDAKSYQSDRDLKEHTYDSIALPAGTIWRVWNPGRTSVVTVCSTEAEARAICAQLNGGE